MFEPRLWRGVLDTSLCDKVCQWLATGRWFSPGTPVSSTNKTDHRYIAELLLKVVWNTINLNHSFLLTFLINKWYRFSMNNNCERVCELVLLFYCLFIFVFRFNSTAIMLLYKKRRKHFKSCKILVACSVYWYIFVSLISSHETV